MSRIKKLWPGHTVNVGNGNVQNAKDSSNAQNFMETTSNPSLIRGQALPHGIPTWNGSSWVKSSPSVSPATDESQKVKTMYDAPIKRSCLNCKLPHFNVFLCTPCYDSSTVDIEKFLHGPYAPEYIEPAALKHDNGKPKLSLINRECLNGIARAMEYGMKKYEKNNYKKGMEWSRVVDAMLRHLTAWNEKEEKDSESGLNHLYHVGACVNMLLYYVENNIGKDDR